ncbi:MAG TPA: hypothetical protein VKP65_22830 [Rhodothermales bacterium]|nr:hypothetical protein [Rhodothermales bacterium]
MPRRRKIEMIIEEEEVRLVGPLGRAQRAWCVGCGSEREMLPVEVASVRTGRSVRALAREVEAGGRHYAETATGSLLLCPWDLGLT